MTRLGAMGEGGKTMHMRKWEVGKILEVILDENDVRMTKVDLMQMKMELMTTKEIEHD